MSLDWLPNLIIAGAPKAGTSSLHRWLADHPDALGSREKETYFFADPDTHMFRPTAHVGLGLDTWRDQFPMPTGQKPRVIVEATPAYLYARVALSQIPRLPSQPKCLFVLREPAAQIYSLFTYFRDNWSWIPPEMGFADYLAACRAKTHDFGGNELAARALTYARYADFLGPWLAALGPARMRVVAFDDLCADPRAFTQGVADWVGLDRRFYDDYRFTADNETYAPRNRTLQGLNVALRGLVPQGAVRDGLRRIYHRANTRRPNGPTPVDAALIAELRQSFTEPNARLFGSFGIRFATDG